MTREAWATAGLAAHVAEIKPFASRRAPRRSTSDRILDAAEELFAREGYEAASLTDVANEVGIRTPSLYKHFEGKRDLYVAVIDRLLAPYFELLGKLLAPPSDVGQAEANLVAVARHFLTTPNLARLVQHAALRGGDELELLVERWYGPLFRRSVEFTPVAADGSDRAPGEQALALVVAFHAMMSGYVTLAPLHAKLVGRDPLDAVGVESEIALMKSLASALFLSAQSGR